MLRIVGSRDNLLIFELHVLDVFILIGDSLCDVRDFDRLTLYLRKGCDHATVLLVYGLVQALHNVK